IDGLSGQVDALKAALPDQERLTAALQELDALRHERDTLKSGTQALERKLNEVTSLGRSFRQQTESREADLLRQLRELERVDKETQQAASFATAALAEANRNRIQA